MPTLFNSHGLLIYITPGDHGVPHIHIIAGANAASVAIETGAVLAGKLSVKDARRVRELLDENRADWLATWKTYN